jgi:hypothetical protein
LARSAADLVVSTAPKLVISIVQLVFFFIGDREHPENANPYFNIHISINVAR